MFELLPKSFLFILAVLAHAPTAQAYTLIIDPISFNSGSISFTDWITLLTLCLAPLLAHIVAGAPEPTILNSTRPQWHDRALLYNPTTILWRYFATVDRRIRSHRGLWTPQRAAASNAVFWTSDGWNGSKDMIISSRHYIVHLPERPRVKLLSKSALKSLIVTAQGAQAIWLVTADFFAAHASESFVLAIDSLFVPLAVMGLMRLFAAFWLLDEFTYSYDNANFEGEKAQLQSQSSSRLLSDLENTATWGSRIFRALVWSIVFLFWTMCLFNFGIGRGYASLNWTTSLLLANLYYMFWLTCTAIIFACYFVRGHTNSTIIPCISSVWYKIYSAILTLATVILIIIVAIETQKLPCGRTTTWPLPRANIKTFCPSFRAMDPNATFGVATWSQVGGNGTLAPVAGEFKVVEIIGYYLGQTGASYAAFLEGNFTHN